MEKGGKGGKLVVLQIKNVVSDSIIVVSKEGLGGEFGAVLGDLGHGG